MRIIRVIIALSLLHLHLQFMQLFSIIEVVDVIKTWHWKTAVKQQLHQTLPSWLLTKRKKCVHFPQI